MSKSKPDINAIAVQALGRATFCVRMVYVACALFLVFGTIKSLPQFAQNMWIYHLFFSAPLLLIALCVPICLHNGFLLWRYKLCQTGILLIVLGVCIVLSVIALNAQSHGLGYFAMLSWIGAIFLFRHRLDKFIHYLQTKEIPCKMTTI